jgi:hypothetical protein
LKARSAGDAKTLVNNKKTIENLQLDNQANEASCTALSERVAESSKKDEKTKTKITDEGVVVQKAATKPEVDGLRAEMAENMHRMADQMNRRMDQSEERQALTAEGLVERMVKGVAAETAAEVNRIEQLMDAVTDRPWGGNPAPMGTIQTKKPPVATKLDKAVEAANKEKGR